MFPKAMLFLSWSHLLYSCSNNSKKQQQQQQLLRRQQGSSLYLTGMITQGPSTFPCSPPLFTILVNTPTVSSWRVTLDIFIWIILRTHWDIAAKWTQTLGEIHSFSLAQSQLGICSAQRNIRRETVYKLALFVWCTPELNKNTLLKLSGT